MSSGRGRCTCLGSDTSSCVDAPNCSWTLFTLLMRLSPRLEAWGLLFIDVAVVSVSSLRVILGWLCVCGLQVEFHT